MRKSIIITAAAILFLSLHSPPGLKVQAFANGVIVTEPEGQQKPAPAKKKTPVKKKAPAPPKLKEKEAVQEIQKEQPSPLEEGIRLMERRFFTRALALLEQAVRENPGDADAWYALGRTCHEKGLFIKAQTAYRNALEIDPDYGPLIRVMPYPSSDGRIPLWDPKRPGRMEDIPVITGEQEMAETYGTEGIGTSSGEAASLQTHPAPPSPTEKQSPQEPRNQRQEKASKLRPFVPVRIVNAADEKVPDLSQIQSDEEEGQAPPVYIPPNPPGEDV